MTSDPHPADRSRPALRFADVRKRFGQSVALGGFSLTVQAGESFGLAGVNGAGKTTLIKCLLDFCSTDGGAIHIFGVDHGTTAARARLAFLPERFNPPYYLSGRDFLRYIVKLHGGYVCVAHDADAGRFHMWYQTHIAGKTKDDKTQYAIAYATSRDGLTWDTPELGLFEWQGTKKNNIVFCGPRRRASGVWLVPVNTHLTANEVAYVFDDAGVKAVFADGDHAELARSNSSAPVIDVGSLRDIEAAAADRPFDLAGPTGGRMHYTSGTTGRPKGVKRDIPATAGAYLDLLGSLGRGVGLDGSGPHLLTGPHYHAAVGGYALFDLCNGAPVISMPRFDAHGLLDLIQRHRIAHTHVVPTMMVRLLRLPQDVHEAFDPSSLTHVLHGAAPIAASTKRAMTPLV